MKRYFKYIKPHWIYFVFGPILMLTEVLGEVLLPKTVASIINMCNAGNADTSDVIVKGLTMVGVILIMVTGGILGNYCGTNAAVRFATDLRADMFRKVQTFSFKNIDDYSTGSLVTRMTNDITQVQNVVRLLLIGMLRSPGMLIGAFIMALRLNVKLSAVIAVVTPLLGIAIGMIICNAAPRFEIMQKKIDHLNSNIQESLTNVRVIKSFVRRDFEIERFDKSNKDLKDTSLGAFKIVILNSPVMTLAMNITTILVVWFGGNMVIKNTMEVGDLSAFVTYITQILMSLMMLAMILLQGSRALACIRRISEVLDTKVDLTDDNATHRDAIVKNGSIEFKNVSFGYVDNEDILTDISFKINSGELIGIIGSTGCGKTSLVQLIPRLYDVTAGEVLVDGINVKDYSVRNLRDGVGMVLQKNVLFSGTIMENLLWGDENADKEEVIKASDSAQADIFVKNFKEGYETELGQGGVNVSGGQKQRLCIARALLKKPKILILDDSTSAVDTATEAKIRNAFYNELKDTTKIIIAQRITSVMDADRIMVLDDGKISGFGTHDELMKNNDTYREIYYSQKEKDGDMA